MSTFDSTKRRLADLLKDVVAGKIQLPDFQRGWVWDDDHIRSLLVSIARSFPVGAVMLLEAGGDARFKVRPVEGLDPKVVPPGSAEKLILDGQQRLTSLTQVLTLDQPVRTRDEKKRPVDRHYYVDIERALAGEDQYDEAFFGVDADRTVRANFGRTITLDLRTPEAEYDAFCFPCSQILNANGWLTGLFARNPAAIGRFLAFQETVLKRFHQYDVPVIELKKESKKEAVCLVFEKVNTGGVPLSVFELVTATYAADGVNLRDEWFGSETGGVQGIRARLAQQRMLRGIGPTDFLQGLSLLQTWEQRKADLAAGRAGKQVTGVSAKRESVLVLPLAAYRKWRDPLTEGFRTAARFLKRESFFSTADLPYRTQLVPLAATLALLPKDRWLEPAILDKLRRWYWCGVLGELYGGAVETRFALDVQQLAEWFEGNPAEPATVRDASFQPQRLDTLRSRNSAAYKGVNVLIQRGGARDFFWKSTIRDLDESDWEESKLDIHHVFPKAWCAANNIPPRRYDSILNKTPISYKANRMIGGRAPSDYLKQIQFHRSVGLDDVGMDDILGSHQIEASALRANDFEQFVESRRQKLIALVAAVMGKQVVATGEQIAEDANDDDMENSEIAMP